jgi:homoserine dehydrogenase
VEIRVGIGLIGCGTVGSSVAEQLLLANAEIEKRTGVRFALRRIAVRSMRAERAAWIPQALLTDDARSVADDPEIDLLVECAGSGLNAADIVERAISRSAHVITANKELIATQGPRLAALAAAYRVTLSYEAAACGAIPIVRVLKDALAGDEVVSIAGVMNGTTTSILHAMEQGTEYAAALAQSQRMGYAESDPANDVEGFDAAHKLALLMQLAFGAPVLSTQIGCAGITGITPTCIARASELGYRLRLIAAAKRSSGGLRAEVHPALIKADHPFARTRGPENVVRVVTRNAGALTFSGKGAGGSATASAVLGDIVGAMKVIGGREVKRNGAHAGGAFASSASIAAYFDDRMRLSDSAEYPVWAEN